MAEEEKPKEEEAEAEAEADSEEEDSVKEEVKSLFKESKVDIKEDVKKELMEHIEKELEKKEKKLGAYNQEEDEEDSPEEKNEKFMKMLQNVYQNNKVVNKDFTTKAMDTTAPSEVIDEEVSFDIMSADEEYGVARELFRTHELTKNQYSANELATDVSVGWVGEAGTISATEIEVTQNTLELKKLAAIVVMSREILEDAEIDLRSFLTDRIGRAFANEEDRVFFNGDTGSGDPLDGLLQRSDVEELIMDTGDTSTDAMNGDYLLELQEEVPQTVRDNGSYVMSFSVFNVVRKIKDDNNNPIYKDLAGEGPDTVHGKPVVISDVFPPASGVSAAVSFVLFGDFSRGCVLGTKGGVRIDSAISGVVADEDSTDQNLFETDQVALRFIERVGYEYVLSNTVAKLTTHSS